MKDSFNKGKSWIKELQRQANPNIVIALAGNKVDLEAQREVETEEAESYAQETGLSFYETSAKLGTNVKEIFIELGERWGAFLFSLLSHAGDRPNNFFFLPAQKIPMDQIGGKKRSDTAVDVTKDQPPPQNGGGCSC